MYPNLMNTLGGSYLLGTQVFPLDSLNTLREPFAPCEVEQGARPGPGSEPQSRPLGPVYFISSA